MNVIVVVLDTLRTDRISAYNSSVDFTPNLHEFSEAADTYTSAFSQSPWSLPSQTSFLSGMYPWQHRATQLKPFLGEELRLLPSKLKENGFRTSFIHNNTWLNPLLGFTGRFDMEHTPFRKTSYFKGFWRKLQKTRFTKKIRDKLTLSLSKHLLGRSIKKETSVSCEIGKADRFLVKNRDRQFFMYLNLVGSHYPYNPPEKYRERHSVDKELFELDSMPLEYGGEISDREVEALNHMYNAEVDFLDDSFGKVLGLLKKHGVYQDSLIVVFSDHGELIGEEGKFGHHFSTNRNLINVPLMIRTPDGSGEKVIEPVELREIHYQVLNRCGLNQEDPYKMIEGCACGIYEKPTIYGRRANGHEFDLSGPVFYVAGEEDIERHKLGLDEVSVIQEQFNSFS
ncbi:sulfatase-like hydrolase/transferase [Methanonatronarchaeum sp. AMET6-2]|uniref:sulfatase-like hydrolase/transferase n=1 Tax=Methanonatronarchaeum sp. AMET6-2 TaxID=2933293 RepID=UPI001FF47BE8|nr:sulfatase-like hydrolase/transferase [Methanonatronarchaeum sp. AMET6-2]UOY10437.1 sulfatase-like hydrolase/transferase [Methanonatronarchaeum sp. AMET6-2]